MTGKILTCPACEEPNATEANFCGHCGAHLSSLQNDSDPYLGQIIGGRYLVIRKIGSGGMGEVYLAEHKQVGQKVAIKFLSRRLTGNPEIVRRFFNEARTIGRISHPGAVTLNDFGQTPSGTLFIIMEFIEGEPLGRVVAQEGPLPSETAVHIALQLCEVLAAAHAQEIIHRDLKPDNIMLTPGRRGRYVVKVLDFGIAKLLTDDSSMTQTGMVFGTPEFMSPEQASGEATDGRADLYALGLILYFMLCGQPPFVGDHPVSTLRKQVSETPVLPSKRRPEADIPPDLEAIIMKTLNKRPQERYPDVETLADVLEEIQARFRSQLATGDHTPQARREPSLASAPRLDREAFTSQTISIATSREPASFDEALHGPDDATDDADDRSFDASFDLGGDLLDLEPPAARQRPSWIPLALIALAALILLAGLAAFILSNDDPGTSPDTAADAGPTADASPEPSPSAGASPDAAALQLPSDPAPPEPAPQDTPDADTGEQAGQPQDTPPPTRAGRRNSASRNATKADKTPDPKDADPDKSDAAPNKDPKDGGKKPEEPKEDPRKDPKDGGDKKPPGDGLPPRKLGGDAPKEPADKPPADPPKVDADGAPPKKL